MKTKLTVLCITVSVFFVTQAIASAQEQSLTETITQTLTPQVEPEVVPEEVAPESPPEIVPEAAPEADLSADGSASGSSDEFNEEEFMDSYSGPTIGVTYDERGKNEFMTIESDEEYKEYHYLDSILYSNLLLVLTDLLNRISTEGYIWAEVPKLQMFDEELPNEETAIIYQKNKIDDVVTGMIQFPNFMIYTTAQKAQDKIHTYNTSNPRDMMVLIGRFAVCLAQVEQILGVNQFDYTLRYFKQPPAAGTDGTSPAKSQE